MAFRIVVRACDASVCGFRCLQICPLGVFLAVPRSGHRRGLPTRPDGYIIAPRFDGHCNACGLCVDGCPERAISLQS